MQIGKTWDAVLGFNSVSKVPRNFLSMTHIEPIAGGIGGRAAEEAIECEGRVRARSRTKIYSKISVEESERGRPPGTA